MPVLDFKGKSVIYSHHLRVPFRSLKADKQKSFSLKDKNGKKALYKRKIFNLFTEYSKKSIDSGTIEIQDQKMTFDLVLQDEWINTLNNILKYDLIREDVLYVKD